MLDSVVAELEHHDALEAQGISYVCLAFAHDGVVMTDWLEHGSCEMWMPKSA
ncbi:MAG: hypothetical protein AB7L09_00810 [Nitrospira sp.]